MKQHTAFGPITENLLNTKLPEKFTEEQWKILCAIFGCCFDNGYYYACRIKCSQMHLDFINMIERAGAREKDIEFINNNMRKFLTEIDKGKDLSEKKLEKLILHFHKCLEEN